MAFWLGTGRIWEDALITITPARNVWLGNGLTHHVSEPAVHSFTSPISVLIPIAGESVGQGLLALRLTALLATVVALVFADLICDRLDVGVPGRVLVLGFLALDQLQIFFGMAGMETQVATAIILWSAWALFARRWTQFGVSLGVALITRPEFAVWVLLGALTLLVIRRGRALVPLLAGGAIGGAWYVFAWLYYGSPIPHTLTAKSLYPQSGFQEHSWGERFTYFRELWTAVSPFYEWSFTVTAPLPRPVALAVTLLVIALAVVGAVRAARMNWTYALPGLFVLAFAAYLVLLLVPRYFMWYLPPLAALLLLYAGKGLGSTSQPWRGQPALFASVAVVVLFALHIPFSFTLERRVQHDVEDHVRRSTGAFLNAAMRPGDSVVLEPLGFIGWEAFNKTTFDYPGLSSRASTDVLSKRPPEQRGLISLIEDLKPEFVALRWNEWTTFKDCCAESARYRVIRRFTSPTTLDLEVGGLSYFNIDTDFIVAKRTSAVTSRR